MPGVSASVNYATEKVKVSYAPDVALTDLVATVEATGYTATIPAPRPEKQPSEGSAQRAKDERPQRGASASLSPASSCSRC